MNRMALETWKQGMILGCMLLTTSACAFADNPTLAMASTPVLQGSVKRQVGQPVQELAPLQQERKLQIDAQIRTLGGATDLSRARARQLPAQKFPFFVNPDDVQAKPELTIGYIRGINTPEAHAAGQSATGFVSSPAVIKVNGVRIQYLYTDGELIKIRIPRESLRADGFNVVQIEAGFYFLPGNQLAYDQIELQYLALTY